MYVSMQVGKLGKYLDTYLRFYVQPNYLILTEFRGRTSRAEATALLTSIAAITSQ